MKYPILAWATLSAAMALTVAGTAGAADVSIPFVDHGGIRDWRPDGYQALYVQARDNSWYRAELMGYCPDLKQALSIGFIGEPSGEFDRYSSIVVRGQRCMLKSLMPSEPPPSKAKAAIDTTPDDEAQGGAAVDDSETP